MDTFYTAIIADQEANKKRVRALYEADTRIADEDSFRFHAYCEQHKDNAYIAKTLDELKHMERQDAECEKHGYKNRVLVLLQQQTIDQLQKKVAELQATMKEKDVQLAVLQPLQGILDENALLKETLTDIARQNAEFENEAKRAKQTAEEQVAYATSMFRQESEDRRLKGQRNINEGYLKIMNLIKAMYGNSSQKSGTVSHADIQQFTDKFIEYVEQVRLFNETM